MNLASLFGIKSSPSPRISGHEAWKLVQHGALLLDVRTPEEVAAGSARGAVNIPVQELEQRLAELPRDKKIIVFCRSGGRSATAAGLLSAAGFDVADAATVDAVASADPQRP